LSGTSETGVKEFYEDLYREMSEEDQAKSSDSVRRVAWSIRKERTQKILKLLLEKVHTPVLVLDIGCGDIWPSGIVSQERKSSRYIGGDISLTYLRKVKDDQGSNRVLLDSGILPFTKKCADIVLALETLEHVMDPLSALEQLSHISRRFILVSVPLIGTQVLGLDRFRFNRLARKYTSNLRDKIQKKGVKQTLHDLQNTTGAAHVNLFTISSLRDEVRLFGRIIFERYGLFMFPGISWVLSKRWGRIFYKILERKILSRIPVFRIGQIGNEFAFMVIEQIQERKLVS
jgi:SAM-dependent methyltransferase